MVSLFEWADCERDGGTPVPRPVSRAASVLLTLPAAGTEVPVRISRSAVVAATLIRSGGLRRGLQRLLFLPECRRLGWLRP